MWGNEEKSLVTEEVKKCLKGTATLLSTRKILIFYYQLTHVTLSNHRTTEACGLHQLQVMTGVLSVQG